MKEKHEKSFDDVIELSEKYLKKWGVKSKQKEFCEKYWEALISKAVDEGVRIVFPHNLGNMQVLEHQYEGRDKEHLMKFGDLDYSLVWIKHPLFTFTNFAISKKIEERIKQNRLKGVKYLTDYVDGDFYVS